MEKLYRLAAAVPQVIPGDPKTNAAAIVSLFRSPGMLELTAVS